MFTDSDDTSGVHVHKPVSWWFQSCRFSYNPLPPTPIRLVWAHYNIIIHGKSLPNPNYCERLRIPPIPVSFPLDSPPIRSARRIIRISWYTANKNKRSLYPRDWVFRWKKIRNSHCIANICMYTHRGVILRIDISILRAEINQITLLTWFFCGDSRKFIRKVKSKRRIIIFSTYIYNIVS